MIHPDPKPVVWTGSSRRAIRDFPLEARQALGYSLQRLQRGEMPFDAKPLKTVGPGAMELRVHVGGAYRLVCVARFEEAIFVLHVFQKKSQRTSMLDLELARTRYRTIRQTRSEK